MAIPQQKFREVVFQMLYSTDIAQANEHDMIELLMEELSVTKKVVRDAQGRVRQIAEKQAEIDALIARASLSYAFERIQTVERSILRLGIFELLFDDAIPPKVAIAEAVRLARKFATPESAMFVNAVLDNLYKTSLGETADTTHVDSAVNKLIESEEKAKKASKDQ